MSLKYELICMDLDGTLLDEEKKVSSRSIRALHQAAEMGIRIALLSGRMPRGIEIIEEQIGLSCIKASSAGTYITMGDRCLQDSIMSTQDMMFVYEKIAVKYNIPLWIYKGTEWYVTHSDYYVERESGLVNYKPIITDIYKLKAQWDQNHTGPNKIMFGAPAEMIGQIKNELAESNLNTLDFARSADFYLEISPRGANKGSAVSAICKALHLDIGKTIAFGDHELDVPMLATAGFSVAMGNSPDKVKYIADVVTLSNTEDGVAAALEKYVLN